MTTVATYPAEVSTLIEALLIGVRDALDDRRW